MQTVTEQILSSMKSVVKLPPKKASRKDSDGVEIIEISDIVIEKQMMAECNDAYFNAQIIEERQRDIDQIEALMTNLYEVTKEIAENVEMQDEKFMRIEQIARSTNLSTKKAVKQIAEADVNRGLANNKM